MPSGPRITEAELEEWRRVYPTGGSAAVRALFPHRSMGSIKVTAHRVGIKVDADKIDFLRRGPRTHSNRWKPTEDQLIKSLYHTVSMARLMELLPGRTLLAIQTRAVILDVARPQSRVLRAKWEAERESV